MPRPALRLDLLAHRSPCAKLKQVVGSIEPQQLFASEGEAADWTPCINRDYKMFKIVGHGSVAVIKSAVCRLTGENVAVKCSSSADDEMKQILQHEYDILKNLRHPHIIKVMDYYEDACHVWMVMELAEQGCLYRYVRSHDHLCELQSLLFLQQLLSAVSYLHQSRVAHRDIKPQNCLVMSGACKMKLTDFNSAKVIGQGDGKYAMLTDRGTRCYSAPEIILGSWWNELVDIWSCGLCLLFMMIGQVPFLADQLHVKEAFSLGRLPRIPWTNFSSATEHLAKTCLTVRQQDRPPAFTLLGHPVFLNLEGGTMELAPEDLLTMSYRRCQIHLEARGQAQAPRRAFSEPPPVGRSWVKPPGGNGPRTGDPGACQHQSLVMNIT